MQVNDKIPGQMSVRELQAIALVAKLVPKGGKVVEIGSLFGRSSWTWAKNVDPTVTVYCIDPWERNEGVRPIERQYGVRYGLEAFTSFTGDCPNVVARRGYSPRDFQGWSERIDLFFDDSAHVDPIFSANAAFWSRFLGASGIACGHDYRWMFPDVINGVHRLAEALGRKLIVVESFWCLLPSEDSELLSEVRAGLSELAVSWSSFAYLGEQDINMDGIWLPSRENRTFEISGTLQNNSVKPVEIGNDASEPLRIGVRFYAAGTTSRPVIEGRASINVERLEPKQSVQFRLRTDLAKQTPGRYLAVVDLVKEHCFWICEFNARVKRIEFDLL